MLYKQHDRDYIGFLEFWNLGQVQILKKFNIL